MHRLRSLVLLLFVFAALPSGAQVYSPKVLAKGQVDTTSLKAFAESIYARAGAVTPRQKAEAIWRYFLTDGRFVKPGFWYHIAGWTYEEPRGEVLDPVKLLNSYGFGLCYHIAPLLEAVFEAGGFEARTWFLTGHTVTEVFYDGAYHHYDSDMLGYTTLGNGDPKKSVVASVRQLEDDGQIILGKLKGPRESDPAKVDYPWYPADVRAGAIPGLAELFTTKKDNWVYPHHRYSEGHTMDFVLRPGERMIRYFEPEENSAYYLPYKYDGKTWKEFPREIADYQIRTEDGPHSQKDNRRWATGRLEYRPVPSGKPGEADPVIEIQSPYVLIDASFSFRADLGSAAESVEVATSTDRGKSWQIAGLLKGPHKGPWRVQPAIVAKSEHGALTAVSGTYGYLLRLRTEGGARIEPNSLEIVSRFEVNPRSLPEVASGHNEFAYSSGPAIRRSTVPVRIDQLGEYAYRTVNYRHIAEDGQHYVLPESGKRAEAVFELTARDGSVISGFDAGGRFLDIRDAIVPDKLTAETRRTRAVVNSTDLAANPSASLSWSTSASGPFTTIWEYKKQAWKDGEDIGRVLRWPDVLQRVRNLPAGTRKVYVRYASEGIALDDVRLAVIAPQTVRPSTLQITHVWTENGKEKRHSERIDTPSAARVYIIHTAPGAKITNRAVIFECAAK